MSLPMESSEVRGASMPRAAPRRSIPGWAFILCCAVGAAIVFAGVRLAGNDYVFFAGYTVLQFVVLATAWNVLGGYTGYVNFGSAAFFALGAYSTVFFHKFYPLPIPVLIVIGAGGVGTGRSRHGLLDAAPARRVLRDRNARACRGAADAGSELELCRRIAWRLRDQAGRHPRSSLYPVSVPDHVDAGGDFPRGGAHAVEHSKLGYGFATIRDDELAAEASGVPTLKLKLIATALSGAMMGMAGAPFPYYISYLQPASAFALEYSVNAIAMPMIGGTVSWVGPLVGALLLGTLEQITTVTISSAVNLLIVGVLLVAFVIIAPNGLVGLWRRLFSKR